MSPAAHPFTLYDSAQQRLLPLAVPKGQWVTFYACGITPYAAPHVGHARSFVVFDALRRALEAYGWPVRLVRNVTDVDDKIIAAAAAQQTDWRTLSHGWAARNAALFTRLGVGPTEAPTVSEHMPDIVALIARLLDSGNAYQTPVGDVYFDVHSFQGTNVAHQPLEALLSHQSSRVATDDKRSPVDFALWKSAKAGEPAWSAPWGEGRPGWHVECSAMIEALFGQTLTIHGGGTDLRFPHHQCEVCQSEAAFGRPLAEHWIHHGSVLHEGEKMSKSLGNVVSVEEALVDAEVLRPGQGGAVLRWALLSMHWPKPLDWKEGVLERAAQELTTFESALQASYPEVSGSSGASTLWSGGDEFWAHLGDNFNVPRAKAVLHRASRVAQHPGSEQKAAATFLAQALETLGFGPLFWSAPWSQKKEEAVSYAPIVQQMLADRAHARRNKDFARADEIRDALVAQGWRVSDRPEGQVMDPV